jgi:hypothetical protein
MEDAMAERGHIALLREGLIAAIARLNQIARKIPVEVSPCGLSFAEASGLSIGSQKNSVRHRAPDHDERTGTSLCPYRPSDEEIGEALKNADPEREPAR